MRVAVCRKKNKLFWGERNGAIETKDLCFVVKKTIRSSEIGANGASHQYLRFIIFHLFPHFHISR
jgi:hypothetical protein